jgi:hypothetical protein
VDELENGASKWMNHYYIWRPQEESGNKTPAENYRPKAKPGITVREVKLAA